MCVGGCRIEIWLRATLFDIPPLCKDKTLGHMLGKQALLSAANWCAAPADVMPSVFSIKTKQLHPLHHLRHQHQWQTAMPTSLPPHLAKRLSSVAADVAAALESWAPNLHKQMAARALHPLSWRSCLKCHLARGTSIKWSDTIWALIGLCLLKEGYDMSSWDTRCTKTVHEDGAAAARTWN